MTSGREKGGAMGSIIDFLPYHQKSKEAQIQREFLIAHYDRFIREFAEMPPDSKIQILRAYLDHLDYAYMIDWYFPDDIQRDMLRIDPEDGPADIQIKKGILRRYQNDTLRLEQSTVRSVTVEIGWMLDRLSRSCCLE